MKTVLFACVHNAGRSQIAAATFNALADASKARAISAGTAPAARVHPEVAEVLRARGVDVDALTPKKLTERLASSATLLVTMGCGEDCPHVPGVERQDWPFEDPKGKSRERVREIAAEIERRVRALIEERGWDASRSMPPFHPQG